MDSNQDPAPPSNEFVADVLVRAMLTADTSVSVKCCLALHALGAVGVASLQDAARDESLTSAKQRRMEKALGIVQLTPFEGDVRTAVAEALVHSLRVRTKTVRSLATRAMEWCGPGIVDELVKAAIANIETPEYCVHILRAAEECGHLPSTTALAELRTAVALSRYGSVHLQAERFIKWLGPDAAAYSVAVSQGGEEARREPWRLPAGRRRR